MRYSWVLAMLLVSGAAAHRAAGETISVDASEFASMQQRMDQYELQLNQLASRRVAPSPSCFACSTRPGLVVGGELLLLKAHQSEGESPDFDFLPAYRGWVGWTFDNGLGVRLRRFEFDHFNSDNLGTTNVLDLDLTVVDLEVTDKFKLGHFQGLLSAGIRYADYEEFGFGDFETMDDSIGIVLGGEIIRPLHRRISLLALTRNSLQYAKDGLDNNVVREDVSFVISEMQLGTECILCNGPNDSQWVLRTALEAQVWFGGTIGDGDSEHQSLFGGFVSIGTAR